MSACPVGRGKERGDLAVCMGRITVVKAQLNKVLNDEKRQQRIAASIQASTFAAQASGPKGVGSPSATKRPKPPPIVHFQGHTYKPQYYVPLPPDPQGENVPLRFQPHAIAAPRKRAQQMLAAVGSVPGATDIDLESIPLEPYRAKVWGQRARKADELYWSQTPPEVVYPEEFGGCISKYDETREQGVGGQGGVEHGQDVGNGEEVDDEGEKEREEEAETEGAYTKEQAEREGVTIETWKIMGYTALDLRFAGYSALDLAASGHFSADELFAGGYSHEELFYLDPDLSSGLPSTSPTSVMAAGPMCEKGRDDAEGEDEIHELLKICGL